MPFVNILKSAEEIPCPPDTVKTLASEGKSKTQIAAALGMGLSTLNTRIRNNNKVKLAWEQGRGIYLEKTKGAGKKSASTKAAVDDPEFDFDVPLEPHDYDVLKAVKAGEKEKKRIGEIRRACKSLSWSQVVKSLERLEKADLIRKEEGLVFSDYIAVEKRFAEIGNDNKRKTAEYRRY